MEDCVIVYKYDKSKYGELIMKTKLAENIRKYRKSRNLTQEQLAEALSVTTGAVYKWESEKSLPEVGMLMELADFFDTSIDVLLGYELRNNDRSSTIQRLKDYGHKREDDNAFGEAEKALQKYPNCFEVIYYSAKIYHLYGLDYGEKKYIERALELYEHACLLYEQNTDEEVSLLEIKRDMAALHFQISNHEKAIDMWKKNNPCGINDAQIGAAYVLYRKEFDESEKYISQAMIHTFMAQMDVSMSYANLYEARKEYQKVIDIAEWMLASIRALKYPNVNNLLMKIEGLYMAVCGDMYLYLEDEIKAKECLLEAKQIAETFDNNPNFDAKNIKFLDMKKEIALHDNLGQTAMDVIENYIKSQTEHKELLEVWEEMKNF